MVPPLHICLFSTLWNVKLSSLFASPVMRLKHKTCCSHNASRSVASVFPPLHQSSFLSFLSSPNPSQLLQDTQVPSVNPFCLYFKNPDLLHTSTNFWNHLAETVRRRVKTVGSNARIFHELPRASEVKSGVTPFVHPSVFLSVISL